MLNKPFNHKLVMVTMGYNEKDSLVDVISCAIKAPSIEKIIVIDNGSTDGTYDYLKDKFKDKIILIKIDSLVGYGKAMNIGLKHAVEVLKSKYVLKVNADVLFDETCINKCLDYIESNKCSCVSPLMISSTKEVQCNAYFNFPTYSSTLRSCFYFSSVKQNSKDVHKMKEIVDSGTPSLDVFAIIGPFQLFDSTSLRQVDYYDENIILYNEELALAYKLLNSETKNKETILLTTTYIHNHVYKKNKNSSTYKLIKKSRSYFIKRYLKKSFIHVLFYKFLFFLYRIEMFFIHLGVNIKHKLHKH